MKQLVIKGLTIIVDRLTDTPADIEGMQVIDAINAVINKWPSSPAIVANGLISFAVEEEAESEN